MRPPRHRSALVTLVAMSAAVSLVAGCSTDAADTTVAVTGTNDGCQIENDVLDAGTIAFDFTNEAKKVNELAHANFKRLKLKNHGAKGGPGFGSRFRRRR